MKYKHHGRVTGMIRNLDQVISGIKEDDSRRAVLESLRKALSDFGKTSEIRPLSEREEAQLGDCIVLTLMNLRSIE